MVVSFHAHGHTRITMFGDVAMEFLQMMGLPAQVPGTLLPEEIDSAIAALKNALQSVPESSGNEDAVEPALEQDEEQDEDMEPQISMSARATPLLKLLEDARRDDTYVSWQEGFSSR